jgi:nitrous oxidase accessory protein NosD
MSLKKLAPLAVLTLALTAGLFLLINLRASAASTLVVDDDGANCPDAAYTSIQAAVTAASAGDAIQVCAGTYNELVNVNKQLTLLGAQAGVDGRALARTGLPATEAVVQGNAGTTSFYVTANDVVIDGFTVQGATNTNQFGAGIVLGAGTSGAHVVNNIIQNNLVGIFLANAAGGNPALIQHNLIRNNTQPGPAGGHGIYADQFTSGGAVVNVSIDGNTFVGNTWGLGISNTGASAYSGLSIQNNGFTGNSRGMYFFGIELTTINNNVITGNVRYGIGFFDNVNTTLVECNSIQNNGEQGVWVTSAPASDAGIGVNDNNITANTTAGLQVDAGSYTGILNAVNNWWGSATGPVNPSNPGGTGNAVIDPDGVVDFTPFLTSVIVDTDGDGILDPCDPDDDNDGTPDGSDQCPVDPNKTVPGTCGCGQPETDTDLDGTPDCIDQCPSDASKTAPGACGCGIPDTNTDGDGLADCIDPDDDNDGQSDANEIACGSNPLNAGSKSTDTDNDNIPDCVDTDDDGDGVPDGSDQCPGTPANTVVTAFGCPIAVNKEQCKGDGWKNLFRANGTKFKNQGDCVQYANTGK